MSGELNRNIEDIRKLKSVIFELRMKYDELEDDELRAAVRPVIQLADGVYEILIRDNSKTPAAGTLILNYLPAVDAILGKYNRLSKDGLRSREGEKLTAEIRETMPKISEAFKNYCDSLFAADILDISVEMETLLRRL